MAILDRPDPCPSIAATLAAVAAHSCEQEPHPRLKLAWTSLRGIAFAALCTAEAQALARHVRGMAAWNPKDPVMNDLADAALCALQSSLHDRMMTAGALSNPLPLRQMFQAAQSAYEGAMTSLNRLVPR